MKFGAVPPREAEGAEQGSGVARDGIDGGPVG